MEEHKYWLVRDGVYLGPFGTATEAARHCKAHRINMRGYTLRRLAAADADTAHRLVQAGTR